MKILTDAVKSSVLDAIDSQRLFRYDCDNPNGSHVAILEQAFARAVGSRYCVGVNSCSSGLFLSLLTAGVRPGDKVAIPAFTFIAVPSAVVHAGATPVLVEMTPDYVIDCEDLERTCASGAVKALLLSYMRGRVPDLTRVIEICRRHGVALLEDAAHSLGVLFEGKQTGTLGQSGSFSAQSYKMIDGGEGGLFVTNDPRIACEAALYAGCYERNWEKHFGLEEHRELLTRMMNTLPAYNFRMSNLTAAALLPQIVAIDERVKHYNANYDRLVELLSHCSWIRVPGFHPGVRPAPDSIQWEFIDVDARQIQEIIHRLHDRGIKAESFAGKNARSFWNWGFVRIGEAECPRTRRLLEASVDLRLRPHLTLEDVESLGRGIVECTDSVMRSQVALGN